MADTSSNLAEQMGFLGRHFRNSNILRQVSDIEQSDLPELAKLVSIFLIRSQWIEYVTKRLVRLMGLYANDLSIGIIRTPTKKLDGLNLLPIIEILKEFAWSEGNNDIGDLCAELSNFNSLRNRYTHHLFSSDKKEEDMIRELKKGLKLQTKLTESLDIAQDRLLKIADRVDAKERS